MFKWREFYFCRNVCTYYFVCYLRAYQIWAEVWEGNFPKFYVSHLDIQYALSTFFLYYLTHMFKWPLISTSQASELLIFLLYYNVVLAVLHCTQKYRRTSIMWPFGHISVEYYLCILIKERSIRTLYILDTLS